MNDIQDDDPLPVKYHKILVQHVELQKMFLEMAEAKGELQDKHIALLQENIDLQQEHLKLLKDYNALQEKYTALLDVSKVDVQEGLASGRKSAVIVKAMYGVVVIMFVLMLLGIGGVL